MITKIVFVTLIVAGIRLAVQSTKNNKLGFTKISGGFELACIAAPAALFLFGGLDFLGVLALFGYEIYLKIKGTYDDQPSW